MDRIKQEDAMRDSPESQPRSFELDTPVPIYVAGSALQACAVED